MDDVHQPTACPDPARAALYGKFLEVAYWMYDSAPNNPTPSPPSDFPADYEFFAWVQMRDFVIELESSVRTSWVRLTRSRRGTPSVSLARAVGCACDRTTSMPVTVSHHACDGVTSSSMNSSP